MGDSNRACSNAHSMEKGTGDGNQFGGFLVPDIRANDGVNHVVHLINTDVMRALYDTYIEEPHQINLL
jgi:hypothetical protein